MSAEAWLVLLTMGVLIASIIGGFLLGANYEDDEQD